MKSTRCLTAIFKSIKALTPLLLTKKPVRRSGPMLPKQLKKNLQSESRKFFQDHDDLVDILLFGSAVKGKDKPNDLDILLIFNRKKDLEKSQQLRRLLEKKSNLNVSITPKTYLELFETNFLAREAILTEAYSLVNGRGIAQGLGFSNLIMFNYKLKGKNNSERMRFYYSLYGRNSIGMLERLNAVKYTDTIIL